MNNQKISPIPDENKIEELLAKIQPVPSELFQRRMTQAFWRVDQGRQGGRITRNAHTKLAVAGTLLLVVAALIFTAQGRAFAQNALQFFTRSESDTFYVEPTDLTVEETTPFLAQCGSWIHPTCSMEEIRSKVDFEVKEVGILPEGMYFQGATGGPDLVGFAYVYEDSDRLGGQLSVVVEAKAMALGLASPVG